MNETTIRAWGLAGLLALAGCGDEDGDRPVPPSPVGEDFLGLEIRPGDSLLNRLDLCVVEAFPETNLPPALAELAREPVLRMRTGELDGWTHMGKLPDFMLDMVPEREGRQHTFWMLRPSVAFAAEAPPEGRKAPRYPRVEVDLYRDGRPLRQWAPRDGEPFPVEEDLAAYWRNNDHSICVVAPTTPAGLSMGYKAVTEDQLGAYELRHPVGLGAEARTRLEPEAPTLRRIETLGQVSRDCLLLPAPGRLSLDFDLLHADEFSVAVGVADRSFVLQDGIARAEPRIGDGVTFAVEVQHEGGSERVWEHTVSRGEVGSAFHQARVDLRRYFGQSLRLSLVSEPGPGGDRDFDYALWSGLRFHGEPVVEARRPHVILIDLDTLRADRMSLYGNSRRTTPRIDRWAEKSAVVYENTSSTATWTLPSTASIMTGLSVHQHRVSQGSHALGPETTTLASYLREAGYETYGIAEGGYVRTRYGFGQGFDVYDNRRARDPDWQQALDWLDERRSERPFFLLLHTYYTHAPYYWNDRYVDPGYDGWLRGVEVDYENVLNPYRDRKLELSEEDFDCIEALYDALIHDLDAKVGDFLERLEQRLEGEDYVIVITSDHGDEFGEHGGMNHGQNLFQELLHVPLIVRYPASAQTPALRRVPAPTSTLDVVPTVLELAGVEVPSHLYGRRLHRDALDPQFGRPAQHSQGAKSWHVGPLKVIDGSMPAPGGGRTPGLQLYDLETDPSEQQDLVAEQAVLAKRLIRQLHDWLEQYPALARKPVSTGVLSPAEAAALAALGYTGDEGAEGAGEDEKEEQEEGQEKDDPQDPEGSGGAGTSADGTDPDGA